MSKGWRYRGIEGTSEKVIQVINHRVQSHFSVYSQKNGKQGHKAIFTPVFIRALLTRVKRWKKVNAHQWITKILYIHTMKYYSALKRNEILIYATIWCWKHYVKWNKAATKGNVWFHFHEVPSVGGAHGGDIIASGPKNCQSEAPQPSPVLGMHTLPTIPTAGAIIKDAGLKEQCVVQAPSGLCRWLNPIKASI